MKLKDSLLPFCLIIVIILFNNPSFVSVKAYETSLDFSGALVAFDMLHGGYHASIEDFAPLVDNLTVANNDYYYINGSWLLLNRVDILFLTQPDDYFLETEKQSIKNWFSLGDKLIFASGDSDYGGYYDSGPINDLLEFLDANIMMDSTSVSEPNPVFNDGASYRVAAVEYGIGSIGSAVSTNCDAGIIMHGPCSILGYDNSTYLDLRNTTLADVEVLLSYSSYAMSNDTDLSFSDTDLYDTEVGYLPAVVYERFENDGYNDSHLILSGESIYTIYREMYDQYTEMHGSETIAYNGGIHYGQMFVNNILNCFVNKTLPPTDPSNPDDTEVVSLEILISTLTLGSFGILIVSINRKKSFK